MMRIDPPRIQRNRLIEFAAGLVRIPIEMQHGVADRGVSSRKLRIQFECSCGRGFCLSERLRRRKDAVLPRPERAVHTGQRRVGRGKTRVERNRALESIDRLPDHLAWTLVPQVPAFEIEGVRVVV